jgi:hypothetical protein
MFSVPRPTTLFFYGDLPIFFFKPLLETYYLYFFFGLIINIPYLYMLQQLLFDNSSCDGVFMKSITSDDGAFTYLVLKLITLSPDTDVALDIATPSWPALNMSVQSTCTL